MVQLTQVGTNDGSTNTTGVVLHASYVVEDLTYVLDQELNHKQIHCAECEWFRILNTYLLVWYCRHTASCMVMFICSWSSYN